MGKKKTKVKKVKGTKSKQKVHILEINNRGNDKLTENQRLQLFIHVGPDDPNHSQKVVMTESATDQLGHFTASFILDKDLDYGGKIQVLGEKDGLIELELE